MLSSLFSSGRRILAHQGENVRRWLEAAKRERPGQPSDKCALRVGETDARSLLALLGRISGAPLCHYAAMLLCCDEETTRAAQTTVSDGRADTSW